MMNPATLSTVRAHRAGARPHMLAMGSIAASALAKSQGRADPLVAFPEAPYLRAADEIIWVGVRPRSMHPRMVAIAAPLASGTTVIFDPTGVTPSPDHQHRLDEAAIRTLILRTAELRGHLTEVGEPGGFATLLDGRTPAFPLDLASPIVRRFVAALASNDHDRIEPTAVALLGLGSGLTPSGDDLVGGALFARWLVSPHDVAWQRLGERLIAIAPTRTHEISVALLADLIHGATYGVLHALVDALADSNPFTKVVDAARALTSIGHSSGWDMLTGFLYALDTASPTKV
ncbi:MAG: DUF2877 domain-containing protein [Burkholderiales bacterium]